ncbi:protein kinase (plasmid) [Acaryochloris sp. 'Moss Beach']|uniref:protein kinase domain-containing protein n=1 Tax=Acaryochloris sp. 'Moss Beach' TaxID=2740837 RepID=UPI001F2CB810|nr:protein kinase [Acaryochloris sp. 'Moss Beach']UJB72442.1 protein kinase [Acaryochloris sp. 'Moss Beach']
MRLCINPACSNPDNPDDELFCQACSTELLVKNNYYAISVLGEGGFGKTYELRGKGDRQVLKVLKKASDKAIELFKREAQFLQKNQTPGIPKALAGSYFEHPCTDDTPLHCLVMEKIKGQNLKDYIKKRGRPIVDDVAKEWLVELTTILTEVHKQGIIHRDIKPQNIIRQPNGALALIDFGAVSEEELTDNSGTETASVVGGTETGTRVFTNAYAAPEQIKGQALFQSDIYSLGKTFIYLLTNKEPNDKSMYDAFDDCVNWQPHAQEVSVELAKLINLMTAAKAKDRPTDAQALLKEVNYLDKKVKKGTDIRVNLKIDTIDIVESKIGRHPKISVDRLINVNGTLKNEVSELNVELPQNWEDGQIIIIEGAGNAGEYGGKPGDVLVKLKDITDIEDDLNDFKAAVDALNNTEFDDVIDLLKDTDSNKEEDTSKKEDTSGCLGCLAMVIGLIAAGAFGVISSLNSDDWSGTTPSPTSEPTVPVGFPKASCGKGGTSNAVLLRPEDGDLNTLLDYVKQNFCADAYLFDFIDERYVRIAAFGDKQGAEEFANYITPYINYDAKVFVTSRE